MTSNRYKTSVTWDGHELHSLFVVESIKRPVMGGGAPVTQPIGMTPGVALVGMRYDAPKISITLACIADTMEDIREAWATLAGWLHVDGERVLAFGDDDGWFYSAVPQGGADTALLGFTGERATITFLVPDARMWELSNASHQGSTSVEMVIPDGVCPAEPTILVSSATPTDGQYVITATKTGTTKTMTVPMAQAARLLIKCADHQAIVGTEPAMIALDEDFFSLDPGTWTISRPAGHTASLTVAWRNSRWC